MPLLGNVNAGESCKTWDTSVLVVILKLSIVLGVMISVETIIILMTLVGVKSNQLILEEYRVEEDAVSYKLARIIYEQRARHQ